MYTPIYFNGEAISQLPVYDTLSRDWELMGPKEIRAEIELPGVLFCPIGAYIFCKGSRYTVNTVPSVTAGNTYDYKYSIIFESDIYKFYDKKAKHLKNKTFQYYGGLSDFAQLIVDNINEIDPGWTVGICDTVPEKTISFDGATCRTALDTTAEAFDVEWYEDGKSIGFLKQVGHVTTHVFERGMGKGLYTLGYQYQEDKNIVTRAFGYGSTRNLPENYRGGGVTQLMFDGEYVDGNIDIYGIKEGDYVNEDIFPKVEGSVTAFNAYDPTASSFTITDAALSFNLKDNFNSQTPKLSFQTGELQGQEFEILDYNNTTKTIKLKVFVDGNNNKLPSSVFQANVGDGYTLFDMNLPPESVTAAQVLLKNKTIEWKDENKIPRVVYNLEMDPLYARDNGIILEPGDKVTVIDNPLGINNLIRVTAVNYPFQFPEVITPHTKITVQIANFIPYSVTERVISAGIDNKNEIKVVDRTNSEKSRVNSLNLRTLQGRIFNPDGTLFEGPESLVAGMAAFGYDSQNFNLNDVTISPNAGADPNSFIISSGTLIHRIYKVDGLGYEWVLPIHTWSGLDPAKFYYVYAKCNKASLAGTWEISETPVAVNDIAGYYAFNLGILYEVNTDGYRDFEFTKGMTYIVGDTVTTGRIKDITGVNYFDLTSGDFNIGDNNTGLDWNVTSPATLNIRGALASKVIQVGSDGVVNAGISGVTDAGSGSVRFWAGDSLANKSIAPFRILNDGTVYAEKGIFVGSKIGNFIIDSMGLKNDQNVDAYIIQEKKNVSDVVIVRAAIGTNINDAFFIGDFMNHTPQTAQNNVGVRISVKNGTWQTPLPIGLTGNQALSIEGDFVQESGAIMVNGRAGMTQNVQYSHGSDQYTAFYENGIYVGNVEGWV